MNFVFEAKYAFRKLKSAPFIAITSILIVASTIAVSILIFGIVYRYAFKPLDFPAANQWFAVQEYRTNGPGMRSFYIDPYRYKVLQETDIPGVELLGAYGMRTVVLSEGETSALLSSMSLSPELLTETAVKPLVGRLFNPEDAYADARPVTILNYDTWLNYYNGDPNIVGKRTRVSGQLQTIIGVMPKGFGFELTADFFLPLPVPTSVQPASMRGVYPVYRANNTANFAEINRRLAAIYEDIQNNYPEIYTVPSFSWRLVPAHSAITYTAMPTFWLLIIVAVVLTVFGAFNIGTLITAKMSERTQELAIRNAMGSSYFRQLFQVLHESAYTVIGGWLLGLVLVYFAYQIIDPLLQANIANAGAKYPDRWVLALNGTDILFSFLAILFIWVGCGMGPFLATFNQNIVTKLSQGSKGATTNKARGSSILVGIQTVVACFLLIISLTLVSKLQYIVEPDLGFNTDSYLTAAVDMNLVNNGSYEQQSKRLEYLEALESAITNISTVTHTAFTSALPGDATTSFEYWVEDTPVPNENNYEWASIAYVSDNYFETLNLQLLNGRTFDTSDNSDSLSVAIIDEKFAEKYWPNVNPLGKRIQLNPGNDSVWVTVVGVSPHLRTTDGFSPSDAFFLFRPLSQHTPSYIRLLSKTQGIAASLFQNVQKAAARVDRDLPLSFLNNLTTYYQINLSGLDLVSNIFIVVSFITLILAVSGIFGILARTIVGQTRNIGVRLAVGSNQYRIFLFYARKGLVFLITGVIVGGGLALIANSTLFTQIVPEAPSYFELSAVLVIVTLSIAIGLASYLPTKKALKLEPGDALRYE